MIFTVTLNPTVDLIVEVDHLRLGGSRENISMVLNPGGKGLNVSRVLHTLGAKTRALLLVGGYTGGYLAAKVRSEGVPCEFLHLNGETRIDVFLIEHGRDERQTTLKQTAPKASMEVLRLLEQKLLPLRRGDLLVLAGSLPQNVPNTFYRDLITAMQSRGVQCVLDTRGDALREGIQASPTIIKPNEEEASQLLGRAIQTEDDALVAAEELQRRYQIPWVIISRGAAGAIAVSAEGSYRAEAPEIEVHSTVGAGDSMVAGLCLARREGKTLQEALQLGIAAGSATTAAVGISLCSKEAVSLLLPHVVVEELRERTTPPHLYAPP